MMSLYKFWETLRERERDKCFVASISLQQRKRFIAIRALSDLANGGFVDSNEAHTYHCSRYAKLSMTIQVKGFQLLFNHLIHVLKILNVVLLPVQQERLLLSQLMSPWN